MPATIPPNLVKGINSGELGITEITVKFHRGNVMRKMEAESFAGLVNMATRLRFTESSKAKAPVVL